MKIYFRGRECNSEARNWRSSMSFVINVFEIFLNRCEIACPNPDTRENEKKKTSRQDDIFTVILVI